MTVLEAPDRVVARGRVTVLLLTAVAAVLFGLGWLAAMVAVPLTWAVTAVRVGWSDGRARVGRS